MSSTEGLTVDLAEPGWADAPESLANLLGAHENGSITFDASAAGPPSTLVLQVILSARKSFEPKGQSVEIANPSETFAAGVDLLGLTEILLNSGEQP